MRVPRFLKYIVSILVILALIRTAFGAEPLRIQEFLYEVQNFTFDVSLVTSWASSVESVSVAIDSFGWNPALTFFENVGNVIRSIGSIISAFFIFFRDAIVGLVVNIALILKHVFNIVLFALGIR